ncbi:DNA primase [Nocardiopsis arvandica]|uniref:DNA primase n=1 Tax=Nocardiopsis sinuspersici TaxID=501010 RepID=A0A7Z0BM55_9ACTN|nr:DNA primase [Nocardiopsis sinuspersici]
MAGRIKDEDIALVRERTPIADVIGEYLQLRNAGGGSLKGLCPFHDEKSPSFNVTPSKNLYYCLAGETRVLTRDGVRPIRELAGGRHTVLTRSARWVEAPFRSFGVQRLMRVTLDRNGRRKEIYATPEHRWFVRAGKDRSGLREVTTQHLKPDHRLGYVFPARKDPQTTPSPFGIAHGITFGGGSRLGRGSLARLDPEKVSALLKWFPNSETSQHGRQILVHHLPGFFRDLPSLDESPSYLYGWLAGYLAADGHVAEDGTVVLDCADRSVLEHVRMVGTRLGIGTYGVTERVREGFPGREPSPVFRVHFVNDDLTEELFLHDEHRARFSGAAKRLARRGWTVRSVEETDRVEEVFCAVVEDGHAFVLEDNILTGNCFGCGEGGDTISFVQRMESLSFAEAVETLARQIGVTLRYEEGGRSTARHDSGKRQRLLDAHRAAAEFYSEQLLSPGAVTARRFLDERGFNRVHAERFGLGYAPAGWENLTAHLRRKGFTDQELVEGGLATQGRRGAYDRFRNRLLWPIREVTGEVVGFGARKLSSDEDGPKYLNSPESPIFHKGRLLYGLDLAKRDISREGKAVVVEGYTDVMACHDAGVTTAVATCGTSFGEDHIKILRRMLLGRTNQGGKVIFTFDGDKAGQKAAVRAFAEEHGLTSETYVAVQPDGLDPCDLRLQHGAQAVVDLVENPPPLYEFMIRNVMEGYDLSTAEGRIAALDAAAPVVASIRNEGVRLDYGKNLDRWLGLMDEAFVLRRVKQHMRGPRGRGPAPRPHSARPVPTPDAGEAPYDLGDPSVQRERQALKIAVQYPWLAVGFDAFTEEDFTVPQHRAVLKLITERGGVAAAHDPAAWVNSLRETAPNDTQRDFLTRLAVEQLEFYGELDEHYARQILGTVKTHSINRRESNLKSRLSRIDAVSQAEEHNRVFTELMALQQQKRALQEERASGM